MFTWSLRWTPSPARLAITSFAFMFEEVPEPVWKTSTGNWASCSPRPTASPAAAIRSATSASSRPSSALVRAAAALIRPSQWITGAGIGWPETGKLSTALSVSPPQSFSLPSRLLLAHRSPSLDRPGARKLAPPRLRPPRSPSGSRVGASPRLPRLESPRSMSAASRSYAPVDPQQSFPALEEEVLERWREGDVLRAAARAARGGPLLELLRGPADRQRPARLPPRPRARLQGHLPALQGDVRPLRAAQGRLGLPRAAGRARGREGARDLLQGADRGVRHRRVQRSAAASRSSATSTTGTELIERIGHWIDLDDPYVTMDNDYIESVWWSLRQHWDRRPPLPGPQGRALLPALRHGAELARGRPGLQGRQSTPRSTCGCRSPRPGRRGARARRQPARLDDDPVDADLPRRGRRRRRDRVRAGAPAGRRRGRRGRARRSPSASSARATRSSARSRGAELEGTRYEAPFDYVQGDGLRPARALGPDSATSSPPRTAPASSTPRSPSARTTSGSASSTG